MGLVRAALGHMGRAARGLLLSCAGSAALTGMAMLGMTITTEGRVLNYLCEPFLLLMLPGVAVAIGWSILYGHLHAKLPGDNHDFTAAFVVWCTFYFYVALLCLVLYRRRRAARARSR